MNNPGLAHVAADDSKLIAVFHADMVGYSRLIGSDASGTVSRLQALRRGVIDPAIGDGDRIIQTSGERPSTVSMESPGTLEIHTRREIPRGPVRNRRYWSEQLLIALPEAKYITPPFEESMQPPEPKPHAGFSSPGRLGSSYSKWRDFVMRRIKFDTVPQAGTTEGGFSMSEAAMTGGIVERLSADTRPSLVRRILGVSKHAVWNAVGRKVYSREPPATSTLLNLGCGFDNHPSFVNADTFVVFSDGARKRPDWMLDATKTWRCQSDYWEGIFCEHVLEHLTYSEALSCLREAYRTLRPGGWLRIVVPDIKAYVSFYNGESSANEFKQFSSGAEAISSLTQNWGHVSVWDAKLLIETLSGLGFTAAQQVSFNVSTDMRLAKDMEERQWESCYVEAMKPRV